MFIGYTTIINIKSALDETEKKEIRLLYKSKKRDNDFKLFRLYIEKNNFRNLSIFVF